MAELPSGTVTFLFTDIEGSTVRWEQHPAAMRAALARHDTLLYQGITAHGGVVVTERGEGDSFFALFARPGDALAAACTVQRALAAEPWPAEVAPIQVRMALHTGEAGLWEGRDYRGAAVNRCARLRALAHGGQVLLSQATYDLVRDALPPDVEARDLGAHLLADLQRPEQVYQLLAPGLRAAFPPLRTREARPGTLPVARTPFLGRERELAAVREQLQLPDVRLVTLLGVGGTGKTRLALQVAVEVLPAFPDGVFFVNLAPIADPAMVPSAIAQEVGVYEGAGRPVLESLQAYVQHKQMLLVLDNFEQVVEAASVVSALLAASPELTVLVTSREVLRLYGEHEVWVPPLTLPDRQHLPSVEILMQIESVRLFSTRAQAVRADFALTEENAPVVAEICRRLDGLPLAIELAAARLRLFTPQALLARLEQRLPLLTGGARDLPARQQTLANTIAWSYDLLEPAEQRLFRQLGVFRGGCTLEAVEAVCGKHEHPQMALLDILTSLVAKSLLLQDAPAIAEPRFRMLETVREFALAQLAREGETDSLQRRHVTYMLRWAVEACRHVHEADQLAWIARLDQEEDNLRAALEWSVERGRCGDPQAREHGLQLAGALGHWYWSTHAHYQEGLDWLAQLLPLPGAMERTVGRARALLAAGLLSLPSGWFPRGGDTPAWTLYAEALAIGQDLGDGRICAMAQMGLTYTQPYGAAAMAGRAEALRLYRAVDDGWGIAVALWSLGEASAESGDLMLAQDFFEQSLAANATVGDRWLWAQAQTGLALVATQRGDLVTARTLLAETLDLLRDFGDQRAVGLNAARWGHVELRAEDGAAARTLYRQALPIFLDTGDIGTIVEVVIALAFLALQEAPARAARLAGAAARIMDSKAWLPPQPGLNPWIDLPSVKEIRATAAERLSQEEVARAWTEGQMMSLEQTVAYAVDDDRQ